MSVWIKHERGKVRVAVDAGCARRPCLHVHWSSHAVKTDWPERGTYAGGKVVTYPLVCMRNEQYGCPHPLPDPEPT